MIFLPFPTEKSEQNPQIPKISDLTHCQTRTKENFGVKSPNFGAFRCSNPQNLGFFFPQNWEFFGGEKMGILNPITTGEKPREFGENLGFIYNFMAEERPKKGQNCPKIAPKLGCSRGQSQGIFGEFLGEIGNFGGGICGFGVD